MAGELGMTVSWTLRSKIWLPAGEARRGEDAKPERAVGEEGEKRAWSVRMGEAGVARVVVGDLVVLVDAGLGGGLAGSSVFFLPKPKRLRFFFFSSPSVAARGVALPVLSDSAGSARVGIGRLACTAGAAVAALMVWYRDDVRSGVFGEMAG